MKIGAAQKIITPDSPHLLTQTGMQRQHPTQGVLQPLYVEALAFDPGSENADNSPAFLTTADLRTIERDWIFQIKDTLSQKLHCDPHRILLSSNHNHCSSPIPYYPTKEASAAAKKANQKIVNAFIDACLEAYANRREAQIAYGAATLTEPIGQNRRMRLSSGIAVQAWGSGPFCPPGQKLAFPAGDDSNEIRFLSVKEPAAAKPFALLTAYPAHIHLAEIPFFAGEVAGAVKLELKKRLGKDLIPLYASGAAGDVDMHVAHPQPAIPMQIDFKPHIAWFKKSQKLLANRFAEALLPALQKVKYHPVKNLRCVYHSTGDEAARNNIDAPHTIISTLALNDIFLASIPGELFLNYQTRLAEKSPNKKFLLLGYNGSSNGYIPEPIGFEHGGYETMRGPATEGETRLQTRPHTFARRSAKTLGDQIESQLLKQFTALSKK